VERLLGWRVPEGLAGREVAVYGEPLFAAAVASTLSLALLETPFDWLTTLPPEYLRRGVHYAALGEARAHAGPAFFKPADDKCFRAGVYPSGADLPASDLLPADTPVLLAEPVVWEVEYRCFVLDRAVATLSPYWRHGELAQAEDGSWPALPEEVEEVGVFCTGVLADARVRVPPAVVVDVGRIADRGWAILEANAAWSSGIYGCDPNRVLPVLKQATMRQEELTEEDRAWVVARNYENPKGLVPDASTC
jgi:hypothetical protein